MKMSLESLLKTIKIVKKYTWDIADEELLRHYTKLGQKFNFNEGKEKYRLGTSLWFTYIGFAMEGYPNDFFAYMDTPIRFVASIFDSNYNLKGLFGFIPESISADSEAIDRDIYLAKKSNKLCRFPIFALGTISIGKFGLDMVKYFSTGEQIEPDSHIYLKYGIALLSLASSMYIKDNDPKLLNKKPFLDIVYEKVKSLIPELTPSPQPVPEQAYDALSNCAQIQKIQQNI